MEENYKQLIRDNFYHLVETENGEEGIWDGDRNKPNNFLPIDNKTLQERICFVLGPKKVITQFTSDASKFIESEIYAEKSRSDALFLNRKDGKREIISIFENKIVSYVDPQKVDDEVYLAFKQAASKYILEHYKNNELLVKKTPEIGGAVINENDIVVSLTVLCYNPKVYLQGSNYLRLYIDDVNKASKSAKKLLEQYGIYAKTMFLTKKEVLNLVNELEKDKNANIDYNGLAVDEDRRSLVFPIICEMKGHVKNDIHNNERNLSFQSKLSMLERLPLQNITTNSSISNTRDKTDNDRTLEEYFDEISSTIVSTYADNKSNLLKNDTFVKGTLNGAKPREVFYNAKQTLLHWRHRVDSNTPEWKNLTEEEKLSNCALYVSTDMTLIDGQHSSGAVMDFLNVISEDPKRQMLCNIDYKSALAKLNKIFKQNKLSYEHDKADVEAFAKNLLIDVNIRGISNSHVASKMVRNQNNIKQQSNFDQWLDQNKLITKKIAGHFNDLKFSDNVYIKTTKDASQFNAFKTNPQKPKALDFVYFIFFARIFQIKDPMDKKGTYFGLQTNENNKTYAKIALTFYYNSSTLVNKINDKILKKREDENNDFNPSYAAVGDDDEISIVKTLAMLEGQVNELKKEFEKGASKEETEILSQLGGSIASAKKHNGQDIDTLLEKNKKLEKINLFYDDIEEITCKFTELKEPYIMACGNLAQAVIEKYQTLGDFSFKVTSLRSAREAMFRYCVSLLRESYTEENVINALQNVDIAKTYVDYVEKNLQNISTKRPELEIKLNSSAKKEIWPELYKFKPNLLAPGITKKKIGLS